MIELKTVSRPRPSPLESAETAPTLKVQQGASGTASGEVSRSAKAYIVTGKGEPIQPRIRPVGELESLIGADDRQRVLDTELNPWRMICALRMFGSGAASAVGTGWLAGPSTIVTAGHCVHHQGFFGGWAERIEVSAGRDQSDFPFGTITATRFSSVDRWVTDADPDFDIGCIQLDEPLGDTVGWFGFGTVPPAELRDHMVNISGYPGDRGAGTEQYFHANRVLHVGERRVFYDVDTFGGQSGAPVWIHDTPTSPPLVVAIHAYGTGGTPFDLGIRANSAPRIIPEVFDQLVAWIAESAPAEAA